MSFNKKFFTTGGIVAASGVCNTETTDIFGDGNGVALYSLDYDASTAPDASTDYSGTPTDVTFGVGGQINYGARFDGSNSGVSIATTTTTPIDYASRVYSIAFWIKLPAIGSSEQVITKFGTTTSSRAASIIIHTDGTIRLLERTSTGSSSDKYSNTALTENTWHHVVVARSTTGVTFFIDGELKNASDSLSYSFNTHNGGTEPIRFGRNNSGSPSFGEFDLDQVRFFTSTLTEANAATLYAEEACVHTSTTDQADYPIANRAYFKFDGSSYDEENTHSGTSETDIEYRFGRYGQAVVFNGTSSQIDTTATLIPSSTDFSVSFWINPSNQFGAIIARGQITTLGNGYGFDITYVNSSKTTRMFRHTGGAYADEHYVVGESDTIPFDTWSHVVWTFDKSEGQPKYYVNGVEKNAIITPYSGGTGSSMATGNIAFNSGFDGGKYRFGNRNNDYSTSRFSGKLDQFKVFDSVLTSEDVTDLYNEKQDYITKDAADPFGDSSEFAFYKFDNNANDSSGSNDGTVSGATFSTADPVRGTHNIHFNGTSDKVDGFSEPVFFDRQSYSASIWVKPDIATGSDRFMSEEDNGGSAVMFRPEQIIIDARDANTNNPTTDILRLYYTFTAGIWNHICLVNDALHYYLYLNGDLVDDGNFGKYPTSAAANTPQFGFGARVRLNDGYFGGEVDHTRLFNRALDGTEVYQLYAEGARGTGL